MRDSLYGNVKISQSTVSGNVAAHYGGIRGESGFSAANSIVAANTSTDGKTDGDCAGKKFQSQGGNLIQSPGNCPLDPSDLSGVDPLLGPLGDNGGPTPTQALLPGSPAIGLAIAANATLADQRGVKRGSTPDSGAFELSPGS